MNPTTDVHDAGMGRQPSHLQVADAAFNALTRGPCPPLVLDCDRLGTGLGLPAGTVPLHTLREWMRRHPRAYAARDAVWRELIRRARERGGKWLIAAVGMAMPALVGHAQRLSTGHGGDPRDIDNEVLAGFLAALTERDDLGEPAAYSKLCWSAFRAGWAARADDRAYTLVENLDVLVGARSPNLPYGHPDLLVHRAAALEVISDEDAEVFIEAKLACRDLAPLAAARGVSVNTLRMRLERTGVRLADAVIGGLLTGPAVGAHRDDLSFRRERGRRRRTSDNRPARVGGSPPRAA